MDANNEGELLAGDGVHNRLEHARKTRWPHAAKPPGEFPEPLVALRYPVEAAEVDPEPEGALEDSTGFDDCVVAERGGAASKLHCEHRRRGSF
jgi:hypothetical protein